MARSLRRSGRIQKLDPLGRFSMWIEKLLDGVVRIITPIGPRYIRLTLRQRVYFLWIFRHFDKLPQQVLSERQQRFIDELCVEHRFISLPSTMDEAPVIGTLERLPLIQLDDAPAKRSSGSVKEATPPLAADLQQGP
jgi:hypothetical protein